MKALSKSFLRFQIPKLYPIGFCLFLIVMGFAQYRPGAVLPPADPGNGGLYLPGGFSAVVVVDSLKGQARHIAVNVNGDIYVKARNHDLNDGYGNVALRDTNNDGKADLILPFGKYEGRLLIDLPESYVLWFYDKGFPPGELGRLLGLLYEIKLNGLDDLVNPLREM